jgi:uncharacterized protein (DUF2236 family)
MDWHETIPESSAVVSAADLERELAMLRTASRHSAGGVFGPGSMVWHIDCEVAIFLAAGRALLLQLAHPWVAAAVARHSRSLSDPIGRFQRTFAVVFTMVFGTTDEAIAAARRLHRRHAAITGTLGEGVGAFAAGSTYRANDVAALRWVFATLADSALVAFELVNPPLSPRERERYYTEYRRFAGFFGIPQCALPPNWPAFADYFEQMIASDVIAVSEAARAIADSLFAGAGNCRRVPGWYRALTASLLPEPLRADFGLVCSAQERATAERAIAMLRRVYPYIPTRLRHVAPYHEACTRLSGRRPGAVTQVLNRFWIGRNSLAG